MTTATLDADGVIQADRVYSLDAFRRITKWGVTATRDARQNGLPVRRVGRRLYIVGRDFIQYVSEHGAPVGQTGPVPIQEDSE